MSTKVWKVAFQESEENYRNHVPFSPVTHIVAERVHYERVLVVSIVAHSEANCMFL